MSKVLAYLRVSSDKQDVGNQKLGILEWAERNKTFINEWIGVTVSSTKTMKNRRLLELREKLEPQDTLVVSELSRLGRSVGEVIVFVDEIVKKKIRLISIKENLNLFEVHDLNSKIMVTMFSLFAEIEKMLRSARIKEALAVRKASGLKLGRPKGISQKSKFDVHAEKIKELLGYNLSYAKIAKVLGLTSHSQLYKYIKKHGLGS